VHSRARKSLGVSSGVGFLFALALFVSPLAAQKTTLTLANATVTFPAPTVTDYMNGYVDATTGVTFTLTAPAGPLRTTTVLIRATSASLGAGKILGDLEWRRSDLVTWNNVTTTDVQVEQRTMIKNVLNDPWGNTIFFRMLLDWTTDAPATYTANYVITLTQTP
jgi:hypothetical protein